MSPYIVCIVSRHPSPLSCACARDARMREGGVVFGNDENDVTPATMARPSARQPDAACRRLRRAPSLAAPYAMGAGRPQPAAVPQ